MKLYRVTLAARPHELYIIAPFTTLRTLLGWHPAALDRIEHETRGGGQMWGNGRGPDLVVERCDELTPQQESR